MIGFLRRYGSVCGVFSFLAVVGAAFGWLAFRRAFDPDEFQHLQFAWLIGQGAWPYRDFFEHHTPLYHYLLAPFLKSRALMTDADEAVAAVFALRLLSVGLCLLILAQTAVLARRVSGVGAALLAPALLASVTVFVEKGIEIRPDQLSLALLLAGLLLLSGRDSWVRLALAGGVFALALLAGQKTLLAMPGVLVYLWVRGGKAGGVRLFLLPALGGALVAAAFLGAMAYGDAAGAFFQSAFLSGAHWPRDPMSFVWIVYRFFRLEVFMLLLTLAGIAFTVRQARFWIVTGPLLSLAACAVLFPVVQRQYLFLLLPFMAVLAAHALDCLVGARRRALVLSVCALCLTLHILSVVAFEAQRGNEAEVAKLRTLIAQTPPDASLLRGWSVGAAFRRPAFSFFSLNDEFRALLTEADWRRLETLVTDPAVAPDIIEYDEAMRAMPPAITGSIEQGWHPLAYDLYIKN